MGPVQDNEWRQDSCGEHGHELANTSKSSDVGRPLSTNANDDALILGPCRCTLSTSRFVQ